MALLLLVASLLACALCGCTAREKKVLLVFSYHAEYTWHAEEARGTQEVLKREGIAFEKFYLDTKRHTSVEWKQQITAEAKERIKEYDPALVMVFDDNACDLVAQHYVGETLPFVFCGVNADPAEYGFPAQNVTGVLERPDFVGSAELLQKLVPGVKEVALLTDDSPSAHGFIEGFADMALPVEISEIHTTNSFEDWQAKVGQLQSEVDAIGLFTYHTIRKQGEEQSMSPDELLQWTLENSVLPEFCPLDFAVEGGALCGVALSAYEQGNIAAEIAVRILEGEKPADVPVAIPEATRSMVNAGRAAALGVVMDEGTLEGIELVD